MHGTGVALDGRGCLILGPAGSGKSVLALALIAAGARLVSDDGTHVAPRDGALWLSAPGSIRGLIEARGIGLLNAPVAPPVPLVLVIDMARREPLRLPPRRSVRLCGIAAELILGAENPHLAPAVLVWLRHGRNA